MNNKCYEYKDLVDGNIDIDIEDEYDDIFILSASFEERVTTIVSKLKENYKCGNCIVYFNEDNELYEDNLLIIQEIMRKKVEYPIISVKGSHRDVFLKHEAMVNIANYCKEHQRTDTTNIAIDITGFSKIDLIVLLDFLTTYINNPRIKLIYVSPIEHGDWLSKGHLGTCNIPGFCGNYDPLKNTKLIILTGFETERAKNLIEEYQPQEVYLGLSNPPVQPEFGNINIELQKELLSYPNVTKFDFSAKDIAECYVSLCNIIRENANYNLVIAPLCTKLSAVACFKVAKENPNIQLVYCYPQEYNYEKYSKGALKAFVEYLN